MDSGPGNSALRYHCIEFSHEDNPVELVAAYLKEKNISKPAVYLALNPHTAIIRQIRLPFSQRKKVEAATYFALEDDLPLPLDQVSYQTLTGKTKDGVSVFCAVIRKALLVEIIADFQAKGLEVEYIDLGLVAFSRACCFVYKDKSSFICIDISREKTVMAVVSNNHIITCNFFPKGLKRDEDVHDLAKLCSRKIAQLADIQMDTVFFCAPGDFENAFLQTMEQESGLHTFSFAEKYYPQAAGHRGETGFGAAMGLSQPGSCRLNFRTGEYSLVREVSQNTGYIASTAALILLLFIGWLFAASARMYVAEKDLEIIQNAIDTAYRQALPDVRPNLARLEYKSILRKKIAELEGNNGETGSSVPAIDILYSISTQIPSGIQVDFTAFSLDEKRINVQGEAASLDAVDKIRSLLMQSEYFENVQIKSATTDAKKQTVRFEYAIIRSVEVQE